MRIINNELDIIQLIDNSIREGKDIEYKISLPGNSDEERKELLADISSFANTIGGQIIFGIREENGIPIEIVGINIDKYDEDLLKIENILRDGIAPRMTYSIKDIETSRGKIMVIEIPKSWNSPHRVTMKGHDKFYARSTAGKYPLDVLELKNAFMHNSELIDQIREFQRNRVLNINMNKGPVVIEESAKLVLHLISVSNFFDNTTINISSFQNNRIDLQPLKANGWNSGINLDGCFAYSPGIYDDKSSTYVQLFRNGSIEATVSKVFSNENKCIFGLDLELIILDGVKKYLKILKDQNVSTPIYAFISLIGVEGYKMKSESSTHSPHEEVKINQDVLILPEVEISSYDFNVESGMKFLFDIIWNACGYEASLYYDKSGQRK